MNKTTALWNEIAEGLVNEERDAAFIDDVYDKFGEIFDIKDLTEYKNCALVNPFFAPSQFSYMSLAIRRAFVEGYLLSAAEKRKENIKMLFNCHKDEKEKHENEKETSTKSKHRPRTINDYLASPQAMGASYPEYDDDFDSE